MQLLGRNEKYTYFINYTKEYMYIRIMADFFKSYVTTDVHKPTSSEPLTEEKEISFIATGTLLRSVTDKSVDKKLVLYRERRKQEDDIYTIDRKIREVIKDAEHKVSSIKKRISQLEWIRDNSKDAIEIKDAKQQIFELLKELTKVEMMNIAKYEMQTRELLERYEHILTQPIVQSFVATHSSTSSSGENKMSISEISREKLLIYRDFIGVARNYISPLGLDTGIHRLLEMTCPSCRRTEFEYRDSTVVCKVCSVEIEISDDSSVYRDSTRVNLSNKFSYSRSSHFSGAIERFQARQNKVIPDEIYESLTRHFKRCGITNETATLEHIYIFLGEDGYTNYYDDIRLIHYKQTGRPPVDISHLESQLMDDHEKLNRVLPDVLAKLKITRLTALNVDYELIKHLEHRDVEFPRDLHIFKTRKTAIDHDEICRECFNILGWEFKPTL